MRTWPVPVVGVLLAAVAGWAQAPASYSVAEAPPSFREPVDRALKAFDALQGTLSKRLMEEMKTGGPTGAVVVCRDEAPAMTARVAEQSKIVLGRTSHRVRNPSNAPRPWARPWVEKAAGRKAADVEPVVVDLGATIGVLRPIGTVSACTTCHGSDAKRPAGLKDVLATHYPQDKATDFGEGDLRGFFWAEVSKER